MCAIKFAAEEVLVGPVGRKAARRRRYFSWNGRAEGNFLFSFFFPPVRRATISSRGIIVCSLHQGGKLPTSNLESCAVIKHASAFLLTLTGRNVLE